jgi:N-acetyltransferase
VIATMDIQPLTLQGRHVRLEPLLLHHHAPLCDIAFDESLWQWIPTAVRTPDDLHGYIESALRDQSAGVALPFVTIEQSAGRVIGSTRFANISRPDRRVEIGWTFLARPWQRTAMNTEAKYLMLRHAFETWNCHRVELKTDALNERSRRAIQRLGAKEEGTLRCHMQMHTGRMRDTVYYSILRTEWDTVKQRLESMLTR